MKIKIHYYAKKYGKYITRYGTLDHKSRMWEDKKGNTIFVYKDDKPNNYRSAVNPEWWYKIPPVQREELN